MSVTLVVVGIGVIVAFTGAWAVNRDNIRRNQERMREDVERQRVERKQAEAQSRSVRRDEYVSCRCVTAEQKRLCMHRANGGKCHTAVAHAARPASASKPHWTESDVANARALRDTIESSASNHDTGCSSRSSSSDSSSDSGSCGGSDGDGGGGGGGGD